MLNPYHANQETYQGLRATFLKSQQGTLLTNQSRLSSLLKFRESRRPIPRKQQNIKLLYWVALELRQQTRLMSKDKGARHLVIAQVQ